MTNSLLIFGRYTLRSAILLFLLLSIVYPVFFFYFFFQFLSYLSSFSSYSLSSLFFFAFFIPLLIHSLSLSSSLDFQFSFFETFSLIVSIFVHFSFILFPAISADPSSTIKLLPFLSDYFSIYLYIIRIKHLIAFPTPR